MMIDPTDRAILAAHDEEIRQLKELHDLHTQMLDASHTATEALIAAVTALRNAVKILDERTKQ